MSANAARLVTTTVRQNATTATGSVIFLHGSGDSGNGILAWIRALMRREFQFDHLRLIFPSAPPMPYSLNFGEPSNVWFDRTELSPKVPEHIPSIDPMLGNLKQIVQNEIDLGIPIKRIVIGGFSMGGAMSLHLCYRFFPQVAGVFGLSCFLNDESAVFKAISAMDGEQIAPLFLAHGEQDSLVPKEWGCTTFERLKALGVRAEFMALPNTEHELSKVWLRHLHSWISDKLPPV